MDDLRRDDQDAALPSSAAGAARSRAGRPSSFDDRVRADIEALDGMDLGRLRALWQKLYRTAGTQRLPTRAADPRAGVPDSGQGIRRPRAQDAPQAAQDRRSGRTGHLHHRRRAAPPPPWHAPRALPTRARRTPSRCWPTALPGTGRNSARCRRSPRRSAARTGTATSSSASRGPQRPHRRPSRSPSMVDAQARPARRNGARVYTRKSSEEGLEQDFN